MLSRDGFVGQSGSEVVDVAMGAIAEPSVVRVEGDVEEGAIECPAFDETIYFLGGLCRTNKQEHEWGSTGRSLRYNRTEKRCVKCRRKLEKKNRKKRKQRKLEKPGNLTEEAVIFLENWNANPDNYKLGNLCRKNSNHEFLFTGQTIRVKRDNYCLFCRRENSTRRRNENIEKFREIDRKRNRDEPRKEYMTEWNKAHQFELKYYHAIKAKEWFLSLSDENLARYKQLQRDWVANNRDKVRVRALSYAKLNPHLAHIRRVQKKCLTLPYSPHELNSKLDLFGGCCAYCEIGLKPFPTNKQKEENARQAGKKIPDASLTWDHVVPLSKGGWNAIFNLVPACHLCNSKKNARTLLDWYVIQEFFCERRFNTILANIEEILPNVKSMLQLSLIGYNSVV